MKRKEVFRSIPPGQLFILELLEQAQIPVGARFATEHLREQHVKCSEATVSRWLNDLDALGYTEPLERKGRVITQLGRKVLEENRFNLSSEHSLSDSLLAENAHQLIDLLHLRRGLESEVAFIAAQRATAGDLELLAANVDSYRTVGGDYGKRDAIGQEFHQLVMAAAHSPSLSSINTIVLKPVVSALAPVLDIITSGHGTTGDAPLEHQIIFEAIRDRDPRAAREATEDHLDRYTKEVNDFIASNRADVINRLLASKFSPASAVAL